MNPLFVADGKAVYPFQADMEKVKRVIQFIRNFPLSTSWSMSDEEIIRFVLSPTNVFLESENALISFEDVNLQLNALVGFVFWDKKVAGNENFLRETFSKVMQMLQLRRLTCYVTEKNRVMWRMLEKVGFVREGCMRDAFILPDGFYTNILVYGLLVTDLAVRELPPVQVEVPMTAGG